MEVLFAWWLTALGIIYLISEAAIATYARMWVLSKLPAKDFFIGLVYCRACLGFWVGGILAHIWPGPLDYIPVEHFAVAVGAFSTMALGAIWNSISPNSAYDAEQLDLQEISDAS